MATKKSARQHVTSYDVNLTSAFEKITRILCVSAWTTDTSNIDAWERFTTDTSSMRDCDDFMRWGFVAFVESVAVKLAELQKGRVADCVKLCASKIKPLARKIADEDIDERLQSYVSRWSSLSPPLKPQYAADGPPAAVEKIECKDKDATAERSADASVVTAAERKDANNHGAKRRRDACSGQGSLDYLDNWVDDIDDAREERACRKAHRTPPRVMLCSRSPDGISDDLAGALGEIESQSNGDVTVILDDAPGGGGRHRVTRPRTSVVSFPVADTDTLVKVYANDEFGGCVRLVVDRNATVALLASAVKGSAMGTARGWNTVRVELRARGIKDPDPLGLGFDPMWSIARCGCSAFEATPDDDALQ